MPKFTQSQQNVIDYRGKNLLVSASAGTGKTTVMIERIASLIAEGEDVSSLVVVTFTNMAAAEMKKRLADKLAERRNEPRIAEQLEKLDNAAICTLHSFCCDLLRNYFYVVDIDPSFAILDSATVASLKNNALDETFKKYFKAKDDNFKKVYKVFATGRKDDNFKKTVLDLYEFSRCLENFPEWYAKTRQFFLDGEKGPVAQVLQNDLNNNLHYFADAIRKVGQSAANEQLNFASLFFENAKIVRGAARGNFEDTVYALLKLKLQSLPRSNANKDFGASKLAEAVVRDDYEDVMKEFKKFRTKYENLCAGKTVDALWKETADSVFYTDKLVEILQAFDEEFFQQKKRRGGVDFNDLEHLTLKLLQDEETKSAVTERYKFVFVDEYQDTNPVQEAIVKGISQNAALFMVGDIKQSIYGFRGCDPTIFLNKYLRFKRGTDGHVEELNENFRSNSEILSFVNEVFDALMTEDFGRVDYAQTARLVGHKPPVLKVPSVQIDLLVSSNEKTEVSEEIYDLTGTQSEENDATQGELIADKINKFVGMAYKDKHGNARRISYGDIVILTRNLKERAVDIYNALVEHNIPVMANFKAKGYENKEVREIINLMRAVDNPYNDMYLVGTCLSCIGGFTENDLAQIKIATDEFRVPFYVRMQMYLASAKNDDISAKIDTLIAFLNKMRFFAVSATADEFALKILGECNYHLHVQGLPNGALRLRKLYSFIDSLKGATYAQSVEKFLAYLDESDEGGVEEALGDTNAVRLMTMHASKGLEFPVVIIAATETGFNYDHPAVTQNSELGLATKYYDFATMRVSGTLGATACGMFNRRNLQEEEMRLLYVAMTRAECVLNVIGSVSEKKLDELPKRVASANSHLDWLLTVLKNKYGTLVNGVEGLVNVNWVLDETDTLQQDLLCKQSCDQAALEKQLSYRYPYAEQTAMPSKLVSSALDREFVGLDETQFVPALSENGDRNFVGTAYHKVYQYVSLNADREEIAATVQGLVNEGKIAEEYASQLDVDLIFETLHNENLQKIVATGKVYREQPFMLYVPYNTVAKDGKFTDEVMLQGVIDLLVIGENRAVVVDFKYTTHSDFVKKNYGAQLASYRLAVQKICGISNVECYVLSIADNKLIQM